MHDLEQLRRQSRTRRSPAPYAAWSVRCSPGGPIMSRKRGKLHRRANRCPLSHDAMNVGICSISFRVCSTTGGARIHTSSASAPSDPKIAAARASRSGRVQRRSNPSRDRAEVQRDEHPEHQEHKNLSDGLEQPDTKDCQDRRCQDRARTGTGRRRLRFSFQWLFFSLAMSSISACTVFFVRPPGAERFLRRAIQQAACPSSA